MNTDEHFVLFWTLRVKGSYFEVSCEGRRSAGGFLLCGF
jgi:hypothetical protein